MAADDSIVTYEELRDLIEDKTALIIDVREPKELKETGSIPGSVNISLSEIESVLLQMPNEEFLKKYGREKPDKNARVVFSCQSGRRSTRAFETVKQLGFTSLGNYKGSWQDWSSRN